VTVNVTGGSPSGRLDSVVLDYRAQLTTVGQPPVADQCTRSVGVLIWMQPPV
jgi:hypothetical protein